MVRWLADNWGDLASLVGLAVSLVGLGLALFGLFTAVRAADAAREAADRVSRRHEVDRLAWHIRRSTFQLHRLVALHRQESWAEALPLYPDLRSDLLTISTAVVSTPVNESARIMAIVAHIKKLEAKIERVVYQEKRPPSVSWSNKTLQQGIDDLTLLGEQVRQRLFREMNP